MCEPTSLQFKKLQDCVTGTKIEGDREGHGIHPLSSGLAEQINVSQDELKPDPFNFVPMEPSKGVFSPNASLYTAVGVHGAGLPPDSVTAEVGRGQKRGLWIIKSIIPITSAPWLNSHLHL